MLITLKMKQNGFGKIKHTSEVEGLTNSSNIRADTPVQLLLF